MENSGKNRLDDEMRAQITRRALAGENQALLAKEFGVGRAYVSLLKMQALDPERFQRKQERALRRKLTTQELELFLDTLSNTTPKDNGLVPAYKNWTLEHGAQLAEKLFSKKLSLPALERHVGPFVKKRERGNLGFGKPRPPEPHCIEQISPEFAHNEDFVAYYLSPASEKLAWREYELALAEWEKNPTADDGSYLKREKDVL